jgi:hypothetical protein
MPALAGPLWKTSNRENDGLGASPYGNRPRPALSVAQPDFHAAILLKSGVAIAARNRCDDAKSVNLALLHRDTERA